MARVQLKNVEKTFNKNKVLKGINVEVPDGSFMVMVGPSGCGKSTALRCIAGLEEVTGGSIFIGDEDVTRKEPKDRNIAMVGRDRRRPHAHAAHHPRIHPAHPTPDRCRPARPRQS